MKINLITYSFLGPTHAYQFGTSRTLVGGLEIYTYDLAKYLQTLGHEVTISQAWCENKDFQLEDGIKVRGIRPFLCQKRSYFFNFCVKEAIENKAEINHLMFYLNAFPFAHRHMTGTCHGLMWDDPRMPFYKREALVFLNDFAVKRLKAIATCDTSLLKYVQLKFPTLRDKIHLVPNYVKTEIFNPNIRLPETYRTLYDKTRVILVPRNLSVGKGCDLALLAFRLLAKKYSNIVLVYVGDGPLRSWIQMNAKKYGLEHSVFLEGHKNHFREMAYYYTLADIVLIPSYASEGMSLACLEAQACAKPVVVTNIGGLTDTIIGGFNGIVVKPNPKAIARGIELLLEDRKLRAKLVSNGLVMIKERHSFVKWTQSYREFFNL